MVGVLISLLISFLLFFILTRIVWVRIIKDENFKVEIHLPIFAVFLINRKDSGDKTRKTKDKKEKFSYRAYVRLITGIVARIKTADIVVKKIVIPIKTDEFDKATLITPLRQHALLCAFIAYLRTKTQNLILEDNAFTLSPDVNALQCYVTVKLRLFRLIYGLLSVMHGIYEEKKRARK